ncbi:MAG: DUF2330 domain-containing protein, partial [Myxococcota bacterium]
GNSAGDIRPVVLTYDSEAPMIPIKLTAVAAEANMGVLVWVLSDQRAVPINYRSLEVNEALINWFNASQNYNDVINVAADEAGGQGFVTEYAGDSANLADVVRLPQDDQCIPEISAEATDSQLGDAIAEVIFACPDATGLGMALAEAMPEGDMQDATGFVVCAQRWGLETINGATLGCTDFQQGESFMFDATGIDTTRLTTAARENILEPLDEAQALFQARGYTTRLYTTMSAAEMTLDPVFRFNPDLATVDNIHNATRIIECNSSVYQWEAPWRIELPSGDVIRGSDTNWPIEPGTMPANRQILQDSTSGSAEVVTDNSTTSAQALEESNSRFPGQSSDDEGCACSTTHTNPAFPPLALLVVGLLALVRRRR